MDDPEKLILQNMQVSNSVGDGMRISNVTHVLVENVKIDGSGGHGFVFDGAGRRPPSLTEELGIPANTPIPLLLEVLREVGSVPQEQRAEIVERSRLAPFLIESGVALTGFAANLVTIASHPTIVRLLGG